MPYIASSNYTGVDLVPTPGETYQQFHARLKPALVALKPYMNESYIDDEIREAWVDFVFRNSSEVTLRLKRGIDYTYYGHYYLEIDYSDWEVAEIISAAPVVGSAATSPMEMATAVEGEVFKIAKSSEEEQLVFGWANIAIDESGNYPIDWDGDITDPSDLEKAAYNFVLKYRATGENHQGEVKGDLVESIMFTKEKQAALGIPDGIVPEGWWVGFHVPDKEVFAKIKSGEYQMFSVEGTAIRDPLEAGGE